MLLGLLVVTFAYCADGEPNGARFERSAEKRIAHLAHTMHVVCGRDGGLIGVAFHLKNLSAADRVLLRRAADGNVPLEVQLWHEHVISQHSTAPMQEEKGGGKDATWLLAPGESRWFFIAARSLFDPLPSWERREGIKLMVSVRGVDPSPALLETARNYKPTGDARERMLYVLGIDQAFRSSVFGNVVLTQASLQADAEKAFTEARRQFEDKENRAKRR